jgi:hypothetical protein
MSNNNSPKRGLAIVLLAIVLVVVIFALLAATIILFSKSAELSKPDVNYVDPTQRFGIGTLIALGLVLLSGCIFVFPKAIIGSRLQEKPEEQVKLENDIRTTLLQVVAGAVVLTGAYFTWQQLQGTNQQLEISREGLVTDRFATTVDQLNSDSYLVRLGGIYALTRLVEERKFDQRRLYTLASQFIRKHSPVTSKKISEPLPVYGSLKRDKPDISAALDMLDNRSHALVDGKPLNPRLNDVDIRGADLGYSQFQNTDFRGSLLDRIECRTTPGQKDTYGNDHTNFNGSDFRGAWLREAHLDRADLTGADLRNADLTGASLEGTIVKGAKWNNATNWPTKYLSKRAEAEYEPH